MAQFYGEIQGNRGVASRMGSKKSGIWAHLRGWSVGVKVDVCEQGGRDVCYVYLTAGSNGGAAEKLLGIFEASDLEPPNKSLQVRD